MEQQQHGVLVSAGVVYQWRQHNQQSQPATRTIMHNDRQPAGMRKGILTHRHGCAGSVVHAHIPEQGGYA